MKVIESTFRHKNWKSGFRCILEFRNTWPDIKLYTYWRLALRERFDMDHTALLQDSNREWIFEYYRSTRRIYLRDSSLVTLILLTKSELME